jgi:molybdopterin synthase sulfur carrier subunit
MMKIELNLFASLARCKPEKNSGRSWVVECEEGLTVAGLLREVAVPMGEVKLIFRNGVRCQPEDNLRDGDRIGVFPPVGGG